MDWRLSVRSASAVMCATACAYGIWKVEWFDVFRWGVPGGRLLFVYGCYIAAFASFGWFAATLLTQRRSAKGGSHG
jgi:hypothetical protein